MARITQEAAEKMLGGKSSKWLSLQGDGDTAKVRILVKEDELYTTSYHIVKVDGYDKKIDCLRQEGDSKDVCPLCVEGYKLEAKVFIPMFDIEDEQIKYWERSAKFISKLKTLFKKADANDVELHQVPIMITREGKPKDPKTEYDLELLMKKSDNSKIKSFYEDGEAPDVYKDGIILELTEEEMEELIEDGILPERYEYKKDDDDIKLKKRGSNSSKSKKKKDSKDEDDEDDEDEIPKRRKKLSSKDNDLEDDEDDEDEDEDVENKTSRDKKSKPSKNEDDEDDEDDVVKSKKKKNIDIEEAEEEEEQAVPKKKKKKNYN